MMLFLFQKIYGISLGLPILLEIQSNNLPIPPDVLFIILLVILILIVRHLIFRRKVKKNKEIIACQEEITIECPSCGLINNSSSKQCYCGYHLQDKREGTIWRCPLCGLKFPATHQCSCGYNSETKTFKEPYIKFDMLIDNNDLERKRVSNNDYDSLTIVCKKCKNEFIFKVGEKDIYNTPLIAGVRSEYGFIKRSLIAVASFACSASLATLIIKVIEYYILKFTFNDYFIILVLLFPINFFFLYRWDRIKVELMNISFITCNQCKKKFILAINKSYILYNIKYFKFNPKFYYVDVTSRPQEPPYDIGVGNYSSFPKRFKNDEGRISELKNFLFYQEHKDTIGTQRDF